MISLKISSGWPCIILYFYTVVQRNSSASWCSKVFSLLLWVYSIQENWLMRHAHLIVCILERIDDLHFLKDGIDESWRGDWVLSYAHFWVSFAIYKLWFLGSPSWFELSSPTQLTRKMSNTTSCSFCPPTSRSQESPILAPRWWGSQWGQWNPSTEVEELPQLLLFEAQSCSFLVLSFENY
jgi:hypothetical protein